jgi:hypothetical protein
MAHYDDGEPDCTVSPSNLARHLPGCGWPESERVAVAEREAGIVRAEAERDLLLEFMALVPPHVNFEAALWGATTALILARKSWKAAS